ncbi:hypothetical protein HDV03_004589 [Kappamyces sp. JEL0829]|nr:hypothetical protein HDV03_004589 [Kappamyces sp. JEL0829]
MSAEVVTYEIHPASQGDPNLKKLMNSLKEWLNADGALGIYVKDLFNDLFVAKLLVSLIQEKLDVQILDLQAFSGSTQKNFQLIMGVLVPYTEKNLFSNPERWSLKGILANDYSSLLCFLVDMASYLECPYAIPTNVSLIITNTQVVNGAIIKKNMKHVITCSASMEALNATNEVVEPPPDSTEAYERLVGESEEQFEEVCMLLVAFVNNYLADIELSINDLRDLADGSRLILLIGMIGAFFVPLSSFCLAPSSEHDEILNLKVAWDLLEVIGVKTENLDLEAVRMRDARAISRLVFMIQQSSDAE